MDRTRRLKGIGTIFVERTADDISLILAEHTAPTGIVTGSPDDDLSNSPLPRTIAVKWARHGHASEAGALLRDAAGPLGQKSNGVGIADTLTLHSGPYESRVACLHGNSRRPPRR